MDKNDNDYNDHQQQKGYFSLVFANMHFSTLVLGRVDIGLRKGSRFSLIRENIVQLGVIFCKRTRYAGNDITQLARSPQK